MIAACDTFRSGAVEQIKVHVRNLQRLSQQLYGDPPSGLERVQVYERGYGKDASGIAKEAIQYGESEKLTFSLFASFILHFFSLIHVSNFPLSHVLFLSTLILR